VGLTLPRSSRSLVLCSKRPRGYVNKLGPPAQLSSFGRGIHRNLVFRRIDCVLFLKMDHCLSAHIVCIFPDQLNCRIAMSLAAPTNAAEVPSNSTRYAKRALRSVPHGSRLADSWFCLPPTFFAQKMHLLVGDVLL